MLRFGLLGDDRRLGIDKAVEGRGCRDMAAKSGSRLAWELEADGLVVRCTISDAGRWKELGSAGIGAVGAGRLGREKHRDIRPLTDWALPDDTSSFVMMPVDRRREASAEANSIYKH
jgi:hypothetical protein